MKDQIRCECCGQVIVRYDVRLTVRNAVFLTSLSYLAKTKYKDQGGFVHYSAVMEFVKKHFKYVVTGYGRMAGSPFNLIIPMENNKKFKSAGMWKLSTLGQDFIHGLVSVPEIAHYNHEGCVSHEGDVYIADLLNCTFKDLVTKYQSF